MQTALSTKALTLFVLMSLGSTTLLARTQIGILKREPVAAEGRCTPNLSQNQADDVLKAFNIRTNNAQQSEILAIGRGLSQIQKLAGGIFEPATGVRYSFKNGGGNISRQTAGGIEMSRGRTQSISSVAYFIHELGHYVGNNNGGALYREYKSTVTTPCHFSRYAMKNWSPERARNEEFAEVFAAFVTYPALLTEGGPGCVKAYEYFKNRVFDKGELAVCSQRSANLDLGNFALVSSKGKLKHQNEDHIETDDQAHECAEEQ